MGTLLLSGHWYEILSQSSQELSQIWILFWPQFPLALPCALDGVPQGFISSLSDDVLLSVSSYFQMPAQQREITRSLALSTCPSLLQQQPSVACYLVCFRLLVGTDRFSVVSVQPWSYTDPVCLGLRGILCPTPTAAGEPKSNSICWECFLPLREWYYSGSRTLFCSFLWGRGICSPYPSCNISEYSPVP